MAMKILSVSVFFLFLTNFGFAQQDADIIPDEIIVQLEKGTNHEFFIQKYLPSYNSLSFKKVISKKLDLYLFKYDLEAADREQILQKIQNLPLVNTAGFNFRLQYRGTFPDDPLYGEQWHMDRIDAPEAWDITTGGPTADKEEIVIAVIEGGDIDHEDVQENIWVNKYEIPDDNNDNDNNGYIDDYYGWNVVDSSDNPIRDDHSTSVMGIIGARGNNDLGVTGVNWNTKMMIVSNNLQFDEIIESYMYVYEQRKTYNETNGMKGAFVVATNSSFGVDRMFPEDNPVFSIWCAMYDSLGSVGVLSVVATSNNEGDIDFNGDMPSTCSSEYLIAVTNTDIDDELVNNAGYSDTYIDLSAPGKNSYTLKPNHDFGTFGGTSAATPHVTGSIGLLYSLPCNKILADNNPSEAALLVKKVILDGVDKIEALQGKTVTEGRLNLFNSLKLLQDEFGAPKGKLAISKIFPNPSTHGSINIEYQTPEFREYEINIYNSMGMLLYIETIPEFCSEKILNLPTKDWPSGVYFITIGNTSDITSAKFSLIWPNYK
jgi:hypothetical protein